jgi:hypothetical protein
VLEEFIPIGRLLHFILVVQPRLNIEAISQEVGQFATEGAEEFPGFHDPRSVYCIFPVIENGDDEPTVTAFYKPLITEIFPPVNFPVMLY